MKKDKKIKNIKKIIEKNMSDEQKQRHREATNKRNKDKYHNMTDEERQKYKDRQKDIKEI